MIEDFSKSSYFVATPGKKHTVSDFNTKFTADFKKEDAQRLLAENIQSLSEIQDRFYANDRHAVLIIFQAMDAAGKDGTIKHVMSGINPQGCQVVGFKQPSAEELDHDYFWRAYKNLPARGMIGIFNRSHYEEILVTKVHPEIILNQRLPKVKSVKDIDDNFWQSRYRQINDIERHLSENGTHIFKFFLNVSKDEQKKRFLERIENKVKSWKFSITDAKEREHWDDYMSAYAALLTHTSTKYAPWYVIPADNKWFMRYSVSKIIIERFKELNLTYPTLNEEAAANLQKIKESLKKK